MVRVQKNKLPLYTVYGSLLTERTLDRVERGFKLHFDAP